MVQGEIKRGTIEEIIFRNEDNGYTVAFFCDEEENCYTVVGAIPFVNTGRTYELTGTWKNHAIYGEQFAIEEVKEILPHTEKGIENFLCSGAVRGIGKKTAALIVKRFGRDTLKIMENEPDRLTEIDGIGEKKAKIIANSFNEGKELAELSMKLQAYGISVGYALKLYKEYGMATMEVINSNPYQLIDDLHGIGFRKADLIAEKIGLPSDSEYRIESGINYTLGVYLNDGNTFVPRKMLCEKTGELLDLNSSQVDEILIGMAFAQEVYIDVLEGQEVVYSAPYYNAEQNVCKKLLELNEEVGISPIQGDIDTLILMTERSKGFELSDNQKFAIKKALERGVSVITGGPGTGKTTIIKAIMNVLEHSGLKTAIAAPTGRAAKRITETSGYPASTIHRLLEYYYSEADDIMRFGRNKENPLEYEVIIIDEASMIDIVLMNGLMNAVGSGMRLIFVGDSDQLPPVGAGNVLKDMIDSEVIYSVKLTEIFRQAKESLIVVNAHKINRGENPDCNEKNKDFFFLQRQKESEILATIRDLCVNRLPTYYTDCDPLKDMQVITPVRKGTLGSINLNIELQKALNPHVDGKPEQKFGEKIFRVGDKVMQIKNNYQMTWKRLDNFSEGSGIFNGDVGYITAINKEDGLVTVVFDENKAVSYTVVELEELEHAYAVTVHKSQGSEFPIVVMPISAFPPVLATRNLLYTAVTRGKKAVVLTGIMRRMHDMVGNNRNIKRYTGLKIRLRDKGQEKWENI